MTQAKRRRRRKHRGTQAGTIERSGRTGRSQAQGGSEKPKAEARRQTRFDRPPTWRGSLNRAALASVVFGILVVLVFKENPAQGVALAVIVLGLYWPMTYYTDRFIYRRRQRGRASGGDSRETRHRSGGAS